MSYIYIGAIVVIGMLVAFVTVAVVWLAKSVSKSIQSYTNGLISEYDDLLETYSLHLLREQERIEQLEELKGEQTAVGTHEVQILDKSVSQTSVLNATERISNTTYRDPNVGEVYQTIRRSFTKKPEDILKELNLMDASFEEGPATKLLKEISFDSIYQLSVLPKGEQYSILTQALPSWAKDILDNFAKQTKEFSAVQFYNYLKNTAELEPKAPIIRVAPGSDNFIVPKGVEVMVDSSICEGIQVQAGNMLYDYCIKTREIG